MRADFTRVTFRARNHYQGVLLQQGRVQLDADWNEQLDIQAHLDETTTRDTVGSHGGPLHNAGFALICEGGDVPTGCPGGDLRLSAGRYYVDGILCENDEPMPLGSQPDLPGVPLPEDDGRYVAYLDVWREHVTALERPELREVALGGPDTATRSRTIWQVRLAPVDTEADCADVAPPWVPDGSESTGRLRARAQAPAGSTDPCVVPATAGYRRLENQLYRVEIHGHSDAPDGPTYVWSRDNGTVAARLVGIDGNTLEIDAPGRDERLSFAKNAWVEVVDLERARRGEHGYLGRLDDAVGTELTVAEWVGGVAPVAADLGEITVVRRWDSAGAVAVAAGWVDLEDGVQIEFEAGGRFHTGDFWLIPARTANLQRIDIDPDLAGDVEWPRDASGPLFQLRAGIEHHIAAVALMDLESDAWTLASDCRRLFPPLTEMTDVEHAGGDGQEAMPGDPLPQPLEVSVSNGTAPVEGARVRFTTEDADGRLAATAADLPGSAVSTIEAVTDAEGLTRCFWRLAPDVARPSQRVRARLLAPGGAPLGAPVDFAASLSIADQVWFDPGACDALDLDGVRTVQEALDRLVAARSLVAVGGDGQDGAPGAGLPHPVEVLVRTDCGPVRRAVVRCTVQSGAVADALGDLGAGATSVDVETGNDGVARCFWRLGDAPPVQVLVADLIPDGVPVEQPATLAFTANLVSRGRDAHPGLHVVDVFLLVGNAPLLNDSFITPGQLLEGVVVVLDGVPDPAMVRGKPVLTLTLDLPFPFSQDDLELWGFDVVGTQPLTLAGPVSPQEQAIVWSPTPAVRAWLMNRLFANLIEFGRGDRVLCHLTLAGRAIADREQRLHVNGLALGRLRPDGGTDMVLPTVDDVHAADFTMWFWLVRILNPLIIVPRREGLLRMKSLRDAFTLALPRDELRARLPAEVHMAPGVEPDPDAARRAADRAFRDRPDRRVVLIADERLADATSVLRDSLSELDIQIEVITAPDPAAAARERIDAGEQFDGVLTMEDHVEETSALGGFGEAIRL